MDVSWTVKKAEHQRIDAFELWCWRRLLRVPWTARRSNQSILKEISPGCFLEGMILKLNTPVLWAPHEKSWLIGKDSDAGRDWGQEEKGTTEDEMAGWHHWLNGRWVWVNSWSWWWTGRPGVLRFMGSQRVRHNWATELNWTDEWKTTWFCAKQEVKCQSILTCYINVLIHKCISQGLSIYCLEEYTHTLFKLHISCLT